MHRALIVSLGILLAAFSGPRAVATDLDVGLAAVDITPAHPVRLNGFGGRRKESEGVRLPIHARAIAIAPPGREDETCLVIVVETLGIPAGVTERLAARLAPHGIARPRLTLCATHTHSAPMIRDCANTLFGQPIPADHWARILACTAELEARLEQVALAALADRRPATLARGLGRLGFAFNRRTAGGPVDHDLPLLVVRSPDGSLRGIFSTYACHCVTLSDDLVGGDWAGSAMQHLERRHPGCRALVSIGCGADANPRGGVLGGDGAAADLLGREYADEIDRLLATDLEPVTAPPTGRLERVSLQLGPLPAREAWEERARLGDAIGHHARAQLERIDRGEALATAIEYPVQTMSFGDQLAWIFLPGEVVVDYSLRLKRELDGGKVWIHAYANACPGYVPSERILREGGYEGGGAMIYYDIPGPYAPGLEEIIVGAVHRQLDGAFTAADDRSRTGGTRPLPPREALATLRVPAGFRVELVAAEPLVESPVAVSFGTDGRIWVAEMADYPSGVPEGPGGRIRCLHDDDGDGIPERSSLFLEGIPFPTGVTPWRDGVLVCAAPDILFAADTDGDGRADRRETIVSGFATHNFQARVNGLEYGLDGWLEGSCGLFGGEIESGRSGIRVALGSRDFRLDPDAARIEPAAGSSQQGRVRNDWGDVFGCTNGSLAIHFPLPERWLRRRPDLAPERTAVPIASLPGPGTLFPISQPVLFKLSGPAGHATAACGIGVYRDDILADGEGPFTGDLFTCEPVNNVVHHQRLVPDGSTYAGTRRAGEKDREFLASSDPWFRPVQARTGPDGGLWVVDMYRYVIEHPIWIPEETLAALDTRAGADRGRIYRIVPVDRPLRPVPRLDDLDGDRLAEAIDSPNGTVRDLVQQRILWRRDMAAVPVLERLAAKGDSAAIRLQALSTWSLLEPIPPAPLVAALADAAPAVRRHAVRIAAEQRSAAGLAAVIAPLASDPDPQVRLQVAASADALPPAEAAEALVTIASSPTTDDILLDAALSSVAGEHAAEIIAALGAGNAASPGRARLLVAAAAQAGPEVFHRAVEAVRRQVIAGPDEAALRTLDGLVDVWRRREDLPQASADEWRPVISACTGIIADPDAAPAVRAAAAAVLGHGVFLRVPATDALLSRLDPRESPALRSALLDALRDDGSAEVGTGAIARLTTLPPLGRQEVIGLCVERPDWARSMLAAIASGSLGIGEVDLAARQTLLGHPDAATRAQATTLLRDPEGGDLPEAISRHAAAIDGHGDAHRGAEVFRRHCATCHRVSGEGHDVGPDIVPYAGKPVEALLTSLFDPHRAVDPRYQAFVVTLDDGRSLTGTIVDENATGLTVLSGGARREKVLRAAIEEVRGTGRSLMPEGFARELSPDAVNDLWAWLSARRPPPKVLAGNRPERVTIDGGVALAARQAEIRGGDVVFEAEHGNVGHWHGADDSVRWPFHAEFAGDVDVWGEWACDPGSAGNTLRVEGLEPALVATVASTGGWSRYALVPLGRAAIGAGEGAIVVRAEGDLHGALVDLRAIHLVPPGERPTAVGTLAGDAAEMVPTAADSPQSIAAWLLDPAHGDAARGELIDAIVGERAFDPAALVLAMAAGLPAAQGSAEEYRRIPWIWRVAVAVGRDGDAARWRRLLSASLPAPEAPLTHWQTVVIGGGLVNGSGLAGRWADEDLAVAIDDDPALVARWRRTIALSAKMTDDATVPDGTRYDALRIVALDRSEAAVPLLIRFLSPPASDELQMGAVSGLGDVRTDAAAAALLAALPCLSAANRDLAVAALLRTPERCLALLEGLAARRIPPEVGEEARIRALVGHPVAAVAERARAVLGSPAAEPTPR